MVKNCPKKRVLRNNRPETTEETPQAANNTPEIQDMDTAPGLFTQPENSNYAAAASNQSDIPGSNVIAQTFCQWDFMAKKTAAGEAMEEPDAGRGRKRDVPSPSTSDDEHVAPPKKSLTPATSTATEEQRPKPLESPRSTAESTSHESARKSTGKPSRPTPAAQDSFSDPLGLRHFISALDAAGWQCTALVKAVPGGAFYRCQAYYFQHKLDNSQKSKSNKSGQAIVGNTQRHYPTGRLCETFGEFPNPPERL